MQRAFRPGAVFEVSAALVLPNGALLGVEVECPFVPSVGPYLDVEVGGHSVRRGKIIDHCDVPLGRRSQKSLNNQSAAGFLLTEMINAPS